MSTKLRPLSLAGSIAILLVTLWAALLRIGWDWPTFTPQLAGMHGPLMVASFFGALIALERAVALGKLWAYISPVLAVLAGFIMLVAPAWLVPAAWVLVLSSIFYLAVGAAVIQRQSAIFTWLLEAGVVALLIGNIIWALGYPIFYAVWWWNVFLVVTIAAERLELGRMQRLPHWAFPTFYGVSGVVLLGLLWTMVQHDLGIRVLGLGLFGYALWLSNFDITRRTVKLPGLPRFIAICLLSGYVWLGLGGAFMMYYGFLPAGPIYDALLHTVFVGFVFAMIFGHAPIIFPAVLGLPIRYTPKMYGPLVLLTISLILRITGDLAGLREVRLWGGLLNATAILIFVIQAAWITIQVKREQRQSR
jgi:hypothetical protein